MESDLDKLPLFVQEGMVVDKRFRVSHLAGIGGMGWVVAAEDLSAPGQLVAIKVLYPHLVNSSRAIQRLRREALVTMKMSHPNIVQTYSVGEIEGVSFYLAMEFIEGKDLLQNANDYSVDDVLEVAYQILLALRFAHGAGVIHRDLKPENVLRARSGKIKVADFGLASMLKQADEVTLIGEVLGTPLYMSPEQFRGELLDERTDIYSFGILLYELLLHQHPFSANSFLMLAEEHCEKPIPLGPLSVLPAWLSAVIIRCCAKDKEDRFQSVDEVLRAISEHWKFKGEKHSTGQLLLIPSLQRSRVKEDSEFWRKTQRYTILFLLFGFVIAGFGISIFSRYNHQMRANTSARILELEERIGYRMSLARLVLQIEVPRKDGRYLYFLGSSFDTYTFVLPQLYSGVSPNLLFRGLTPLQFWSKYLDHPSQMLVVRELLNAGADMTTRSEEGKLAVEYAIDSSSEDVVQEMLLRRMPPNLLSADGDPILLYAIKKRQMRIAQLLLEFGADPRLRSKAGQSALGYAKESGLSAFVTLVENQE